MSRTSNRLAAVAQALSDSSRLSILQYLMGGPATASELAAATSLNPSSASNHLLVLREQKLVTVNRRGRQRVYGIAGTTVAQLIESLSVVAGVHPKDVRTSPGLVAARTCYDHLAGRLGVAINEALISAGAIDLDRAQGGKARLGQRAGTVFAKLGVDVNSARKQRRLFVGACIDWTEAKSHLSGALGAAVCARAFDNGWVRRKPGTRALDVSKTALAKLRQAIA